MTLARLRSRTVISAWIGVWVPALLAGCAASPMRGRHLANERDRPTREQLRDLSELGIGILRLAVLANSVRAEGVLQQKLDERIAQIEKERSESLETSGVITTVAGFLVVAYMGMIQSTDDFSSSTDPADRTSTPRSAKITYSVGGAILLSGVAVLIADASGTGSLREDPATKATREAAAKEQARLKAELDRNLTAISVLYADIFNLPASAQAGLKTHLRTEFLLRARPVGIPPRVEDPIRIDVPRLMLQKRLITDREFVAFRAKLGSLEALEIAEQTRLAETMPPEAYAANLAEYKRFLDAYADWLRAIRSDLSEGDAARVDRALAKTDRLRVRI